MPEETIMVIFYDCRLSEDVVTTLIARAFRQFEGPAHHGQPLFALCSAVTLARNSLSHSYRIGTYWSPFVALVVVAGITGVHPHDTTNWILQI